MYVATWPATNAWISSAVAVLPGLQDDVSRRDLAGLLVGQADDGGVRDRRVREQQRLELGGQPPGSPCT